MVLKGWEGFMEQFLKGRTALVTGSVQGIGMAIAGSLASAGARIGVHGLATQQEAADAIELMRQSGAPDARFFEADMRKPSAIEAMMEAVTAWGGPDILVNNAGIQRTVSLAEATQQVWDDIIAVNLSGAFHTMRARLAGNGPARLWAGNQHRVGAWLGSFGQQGALCLREIRFDRIVAGSRT